MSQQLPESRWLITLFFLKPCFLENLDTILDILFKTFLIQPRHSAMKITYIKEAHNWRIFTATVSFHLQHLFLLVVVCFALVVIRLADGILVQALGSFLAAVDLFFDHLLPVGVACEAAAGPDEQDNQNPYDGWH